MKTNLQIAIWVLSVVLGHATAWAADSCEVCGERFTDAIYLLPDKVAGVQRQLCKDCTRRTTVCYLCGVPVARNLTTLPDGRVLCARDAKAVVLDEAEAEQLIREVKDTLDRQFSRFTTFPDENVTVRMVDRQALQESFKFAGNDLSCPVVWGCTVRGTNAGAATHTISLLSGLPRPLFRATCAHEYVHVWVNENVSAARRKQTDQDAVEGFCELVAYLLMEAQGAAASTALIRSNTYTRGQLSLFLDAERRFGFNEVVEWMQYGVDARLVENDTDRIRKVDLPRRVAAAAGQPGVPSAPPPPPPAPDKLTLSGIVWSPAQPLALINGHSFAVDERGKVRLGPTNATLRCLAIGQDWVRVRVEESGEETELKLKRN